MAVATFHSFRGEKSALIMVKANAFVFSASPVYVPKAALPENIQEGESFEIPDDYKLVPIVDIETGEVRVTKTGEQLNQLQY